jgi:hypothetical protein
MRSAIEFLPLDASSSLIYISFRLKSGCHAFAKMASKSASLRLNITGSSSLDGQRDAEAFDSSSLSCGNGCLRGAKTQTYPASGGQARAQRCRAAMGPALCSEIKEEHAAISRKRGTFAEEGRPRRSPGQREKTWIPGQARDDSRARSSASLAVLPLLAPEDEQQAPDDDGADPGPDGNVDRLLLFYGELERPELHGRGGFGVAETTVGECEGASDDQDDGSKFDCTHVVDTFRRDTTLPSVNAGSAWRSH